MLYINTINKLRKLCEDKDLDKIVKFLDHKDDEIRKAALLCLQELNDKKAIKSIETLINVEEDGFVLDLAKKVLVDIKAFGIPEPIDIAQGLKSKSKNKSALPNVYEFKWNS
jgi:HEAT repeat protein